MMLHKIRTSNKAKKKLKDLRKKPERKKSRSNLSRKLKMLNSLVLKQRLKHRDRSKKLKDLNLKDSPKKLKKPNVKLKRMLKLLKKKDLKQKKRLKRLLSKEMDQKINLNCRKKKHYRKLKRRSLQRRRKKL